MANNGFFDSVNGDRVYSASDFGRMFEGLISDGIVRDWGNGMSVSQMMGSTFMLRSGRAYFNGCWLTSDDVLSLDMTMTPNVGKHQMAAIAIKVDFSNRLVSIERIFGDPDLSTDTTAGMCSDMATRLASSSYRYGGVHYYVIATVICYSGNYTMTDHRGGNCPSGYSAISSYLANWALGITNTGALPTAFDYGSATSKPQINGITLEGNKTGQELGITGSYFINTPPTITQSGSTVVMNYSGITGLPSGSPKKITLYGWVSVAYFKATLIKSASNDTYAIFAIAANPIENSPFTASMSSSSTYSLSGTNLTITLNGISNWRDLTSIISTELVW